MKQLFLNGTATTLFFSKNSSFYDIFEWVQEQAMFLESNLFNLNQQHSCSVNNSLNGGIYISGDEDLKTVTIEEITPIL